ncbi:unnamed protein product [Bursaphelenchus xylophilus]|uniref:(pine wood nematode) hypothetical protein n=1 Tax=Bursaphelenchus xylophilus TaxID=6326 RepID=A0A1I7RP12_BURXY|nr:unnamed protein product [Bursaphelenchus xylophilus]CAG9124444.1 unnamed protein product [Bursaphelenchus xylophilus]
MGNATEIQWLQMLQQHPQLPLGANHDLHLMNSVNTQALTSLNPTPMVGLGTTGSAFKPPHVLPNLPQTQAEQDASNREPSQIAATIMTLQNQQEALPSMNSNQMTLIQLLQQQQQQQVQQELLNLLLANQNPALNLNDVQQLLQLQMQQLHHLAAPVTQPQQIRQTAAQTSVPQSSQIPQPTAAQEKRSASTELPSNSRKRSGDEPSGAGTPPKKTMAEEQSPSPKPEMRERAHTLPVRIIGREAPKRTIDPFDPIQNAKYKTDDPNSPYRHHPINQKRSKNAEIIADICRDFVELVLKRSPDFHENGLWFSKN